MTETRSDLLKQAFTVFRISDIRLYRQALCTERLHFFFHFFHPVRTSGAVDHDPVSAESKF